MARKPLRRFRNFILIGLPGSGKTTFGKILAQTTRREFLDLDRIIRATTGKTIPQIFEKEGEEGFRSIESKCLRKLERRNNSVIALGGGTLCTNENLDTARHLGFIVFLSTPLDVLAQRLFAEKDSRPLFAACENAELIRERLEQLWESRKEFYLKADLVLETAHSSWDTLKFQLVNHERRQFHQGYQNDLQRLLHFGKNGPFLKIENRHGEQENDNELDTDSDVEGEVEILLDSSHEQRS